MKDIPDKAPEGTNLPMLEVLSSLTQLQTFLAELQRQVHRNTQQVEHLLREVHTMLSSSKRPFDRYPADTSKDIVSKRQKLDCTEDASIDTDLVHLTRTR